MKILAILFAVLAVVAASKPMIYSVVTEFTSDDYATASHLVTIDPKTGAVGELMETFYYAGSSMTYDGISAFDFMNGIYYYATDASSAFVFRGNVKTKSLMSPIALPFEYIFEITYDASQKRIIVAGAADKQGDFLVALPTDESKPWSVLAHIDTDFSFEFGTIDSVNQIYYWLTLEKVNSTYSNVFLHSISLSNPSGAIKTVPVMCNYPMLYPNSIRYDSVHKQLYIFSTQWIPQGKNWELVYYIETLSTSGACSSVKTQIPNGIVSDWAYDAITGNVYAAFGNYLYTLDVKTGQVLSNVVIGDSLEPESMEFVYV
eukprot:TRINITY_DN4391_c0_g1_i1.p1 TRINITY_DN4391_c0_g1~~TRINITY_DN4391_c0_g1_i1.p1  ORF type:complete len:317 (+),score=46.08 TRINITY_DN4391_c0_g1_i1:66-1016(+)